MTFNRPDGTSTLISDGPAPHTTTDAARPGFASAYIWSTAGNPAPAELDREPNLNAIEPPGRGHACHVLTFPPDEAWADRVGATEVAAFFAVTGSPDASTYSPDAPHPYMQRTSTLEFALVLSGEVTLVLDTTEVHLATGDIVVQRGTNHSWSNRSGSAAVVAVTSHAGA